MSVRTQSKRFAKAMVRFIEQSPTAYQAVSSSVNLLKEAGFTVLSEGDRWKLRPGGQYIVSRNDSTVVAFRMGYELPFEAGFSVIGAHTDSPSFKLKINSEHITAGALTVTTEVYGGPIISSWLDRELGIAGRVMVRRGAQWHSEPIVLKDATAVIPNAAIHLNREINKGFEYNKQQHLKAFLSVKGAAKDSGSVLTDTVAKQCGVSSEDVGAMDLYLFDREVGSVFPDGAMVHTGRLDNLASCYAAVQALISSETASATQVVLLFDNEEIGSRSAMGADSSLASTLLERIVISSGGTREDYHRALAKSVLFSADGAHAIHPSFPEKHDPDYAPTINGGPVIKQSASFRYATTAETTELFKQWAQRAGVPVQYAINRSDMPSGSTIGPIAASRIGIATVDAGIPMLAMHSAREITGTDDPYYFFLVMQSFFNNKEESNEKA